MPRHDPFYATLLQGRIDSLQKQREALRVAISEMRTARSLTFADDEHDPEGSTVSLDQARDAALLSRTERSLTELRAAQQRHSSGTFGRCQRCGQNIPAERLQARPEARFCVPCSR
jgi:RNA polymerase-binding transcription factor DksA